MVISDVLVSSLTCAGHLQSVSACGQQLTFRSAVHYFEVASRRDHLYFLAVMMCILVWSLILCVWLVYAWATDETGLPDESFENEDLPQRLRLPRAQPSPDVKGHAPQTARLSPHSHSSASPKQGGNGRSIGIASTVK